MPGNDFGFVPDSNNSDFGFVPDEKPKKTNPSLVPRVGADLLAGTAQNGHELINAPSNIANYLASKGMIGADTAKSVPRQQDYNYGGMLGVNDPNVADKILQFLPGMAPYIAGGEAAGLAKAPAFVGNLTKNLAPTAQRSADILGMIGKNGMFGAAANLAAGGSPLAGAGAGILGGGVGEGINAGVNALRPSNLFAGGANPQQLAENLQAAKGTNTPLGNITQSPGVSRLYDNILTKIPFSGAVKKLQNVGQQISEQGKGILQGLLNGNDAGDVGATLQKSLKDKLATLEDMKRHNFALPNSIADEMGLTIGRDNFSSAAQKALDKLNKSPELARETDPTLLSDLQAYSNKDAGNTLELSNIFKGKINDKASDAFINNKKFEYGIYQDLKKSLQKDLDNGIKGSGNDLLKTAHDKSMQFYKEHIAPFEDPNILKFTKQGGDADTLLSTFIKSGGINDRGNLVDTLVSKLPENEKHLPAYGYLSKAMDEKGNIDADTLAKQWNKLGQKQQAALVPDPARREELNRFSTLVGMNGKALNIMANPPTGQQWMDLIPFIGGSAALNYAGLPVLAKAAAGGMFAARPLSSVLTNEKIRNSIVQKMIEARGNAPIVGNKAMGMFNGIPAIYNNQNEQ